jgi:hypothetical protein
MGEKLEHTVYDYFAFGIPGTGREQNVWEDFITIKNT